MMQISGVSFGNVEIQIAVKTLSPCFINEETGYSNRVFQ